MKGWGPWQTSEATGGSRVPKGRMGFICTRPCQSGRSVET